MKSNFLKLCILLICNLAYHTISVAQNIETPSICYLKHSSNNILIKGTENRAILESPEKSEGQTLRFVPDNDGWYTITTADGTYCLTLSGQWNTYFTTDNGSDNAKYTIEPVNHNFIRIKCKANNKYLGVDDIVPGAYVYSDKSGTDSRHHWYLTTDAYAVPPTDTLTYIINPEATRQLFKGWGVSLCWWANMCGKWSDEKIDEIVDWLVSPDGLNFSFFRYNIGGGDDPQNRNCTPHHMGSGKGLRAEMEGFKDSSEGDYIWSRDAAQRKIMLKIKEKRPDAVFEAFSNSCPYYMTYSGCCAGNTDAGKDNLKPEYYEEFAHYLVDVCKHYKDEYGIEFRTLEPFNEPMTSYWGANGGQEGCHFDYSSQIAFLKVLAPILKESGLNTIIAASDETSVAQSVSGFEAYREAGILDLVGQWNVHTYSADQPSRCNLSALCKDSNIPLWMSEVGAGGSGLAGNLSLAQKLMNDIRYMMPEVWTDWQYIEEGNDQWCLVQGEFEAQNYWKVKNYSVRQHFSKYIKAGYTFLTSLNDQTLAARNAAGDTLVIVAINTESLPVCHQADLSFYKNTGSDITCLLTTQEQDLAPYNDYTLNNGLLSYTLPGLSIATFIIPVTAAEPSSPKLETGKPYVIVPRAAGNMTLQAENGNVTISGNKNLASQQWILTETNGLYTLSNENNEIITSQQPTYYLTSKTESGANQQFRIEPIDDVFYKIMTEDESKVFDLEGNKITDGTRVGLWEYGDSPAAFHRQWQFIRLPDDLIPDAVHHTGNDNSDSAPVIIKSSTGYLHIIQKEEQNGQLIIYSANGNTIYQRLLTDTTTDIPLKQGIYIICYKLQDAQYSKLVSITD